jgi:Flp pilus assembly protein TadD
LSDAGQWSEALAEFRAAERGGEPDDSLSFRIGQVLEATGHRDEATAEYKTFLKSKTCAQSLPDERCAAADRRAGSGY